MESKNLIIFDMDGVLVDVSESYREAIRMTARHFFQGAPAYDELPNPLFSLQDLAEVKQSGGLNNDWETTYRVLTLLMTQIDLPDILQDNDPWRLRQQTMVQCDLSNLTAFLKSHPYPLKTLLQKNDRKESGFVNKLSSGDVGSGNIIKQIFQEIYLGKELFKTIYSTPPKADYKNGLIDQEKLMVEHAFLDMLSRNHILAIATGRPKAEAAYPLKRFNIRNFFHTVLTLDDCLEEEQKRATQTGEWVSLSKPHPFMLDVIVRTSADKVKKNFYIGDMPDDMVAAQTAKADFTGIGIISPSPDKKRLKNLLIQAGADFVIDELKELEKVLLSEET